MALERHGAHDFRTQVMVEADPTGMLARRTKSRMRILQTIAGLWSITGGPAESVPALCSGLSKLGHDVTILTGEGDLAQSVLRASASVRVQTAPVGPYWMGNYSAEFGAACEALAEKADILHTHGLWLYPNFVTSFVGRRLRRPVVVSPRGMLSPWSLRQGKLKKALVWWALQRRMLSRADMVHATSDEEANEFRRLKIAAPIAVIPNGLNLNDFDLNRATAVRETGRTRSIVFMSRIHPKKGIGLLLDAWRLVSVRHPDATLVLAGPGEPIHVSELCRRLEQENLDSVRYVGRVDADERFMLLAGAAAMVLPSYSENYGMVVAESLACGTPVVVTSGVPWPQVSMLGCGWRVSPEVGALSDALNDALATGRQRLDEMGAIGRHLIEQAHSVEVSATRMAETYAWLVKGGTSPGFVQRAVA